MKKWILVTTLASILALSAIAFAEPGNARDTDGPRVNRALQRTPGPGAQMHPGMMLERILSNPEAAERLDLSEEQIASLKDLKLRAAREVIPLRSKAELAQLDLHEAMGATPPDVDAIMSAIDQVHQTQAEVQKAEVRSRLAAREIIGAEKLAGIRDGVRERMQNRFSESDRPVRPRRPGPAAVE